MKQIVLASASPRRKEILENAGIMFLVDPSDYVEDLSLDMEPRTLARFLSREKARSVAVRHPKAVTIAADTFIVFKKHILGKPHTAAEARKMLTLLNGKVHSVITGYTVVDPERKKRVSKAEETKVWFRKLSGAEINDYVRSGEPLDKAGAYAIQGLGAMIVKKIEGDYLNVVGLPLCSLIETLKKFGLRVL